MILLDAEVGNTFVHGKDTGTFGVVPLDIDAGVKVTLPVFSDVILFFEGISKVVDMAVANISNFRGVNDEGKEYGAPFVAPKSRCGGGLVVAVYVGALFGELVGEHAILG